MAIYADGFKKRNGNETIVEWLSRQTNLNLKVRVMGIGFHDCVTRVS